MTVLSKFLSLYFKTGLRGSTRLTDFLSRRIKSLQQNAVQTKYGLLYADLRIPTYRGIMGGEFDFGGDELVMQKLIDPGDIVFDIGVLWGLYTLFLSKLVGEKGRVFAFEPNPSLLPSLMRTIDLLPNVELCSFALSDREGEATFFVPQNDASMASLVDWTDGSAGDVEYAGCQMRRMDRLINTGQISFPDFIKCDVEGAELSVIKGGEIVFDREDAPIIMFEVNPKAALAFGYDANSCIEFLRSLEKPNYAFFEILKRGLKPVSNADDMDFSPHGFTNAVAIPERKNTRLERDKDLLVRCDLRSIS